MQVHVIGVFLAIVRPPSRDVGKSYHSVAVHIFSDFIFKGSVYEVAIGALYNHLGGLHPR